MPYHTDSIVAPHDGAKTAPTHPLRCLQYCPRPIVRPQLLVSVTPEPGDKSVYPKPPTLVLCMELIRQARRQFRGVGGRTLEGTR